MTVDQPNYTRKSDLALSAVEDPALELARSTAYIDRQLERIDQVRELGFDRLADRYLDRLIDSIVPPATPITESELRALWGDR